MNAIRGMNAVCGSNTVEKRQLSRNSEELDDAT
jgi:hypothetical protein